MDGAIKNWQSEDTGNTTQKTKKMSNTDTTGGEARCSQRLGRKFAYNIIIFQEFWKTDKFWFCQNLKTDEIVNIVINF